MNLRKRTLWLTRTAVLLAVLIVLQWTTKPLGQIVTGSCVNGVLAIAALCAGLPSALCVAVLSPILAFLLGIGPAFFPLTPVIAAGNCVYVLIIWALAGKASAKIPAMVLGAAVAACAKAAVLYLLVVQVVCRFASLAPKQVETFTTMFSLPQLTTALIGGAVAVAVAIPVKHALKR